MEEFTTDIINVEDLLLDVENPRFCHISLSGKKLSTQKELEDEILNDDDINALIKTIKKSGVIDPIWVKQKNDNSKFIVIEGNRRTTILRKLIRDKVVPPKGVSYDKVKANIYDSKISKQEELLQKARLQTGKKVWGPFNEAAVTYKLRNELRMEYDDISVDLQISVTKVKRRIDDFILFSEYVKVKGDLNPKKFAFFSDAPKKVRGWFLEDDKNKQIYFDLISSKEGNQKIRSVATKGGLREFEKIIDSKPALDYLIEDEDATVELALEMVKEIDLTVDIPFITKLSSTASNLMGLNIDQIKRVSKEPKYIGAIKQMKRACDFILDELAKLE